MRNEIFLTLVLTWFTSSSACFAAASCSGIFSEHKIGKAEQLVHTDLQNIMQYESNPIGRSEKMTEAIRKSKISLGELVSYLFRDSNLRVKEAREFRGVRYNKSLRFLNGKNLSKLISKKNGSITFSIPYAQRSIYSDLINSTVNDSSQVATSSKQSSVASWFEPDNDARRKLFNTRSDSAVILRFDNQDQFEIDGGVSVREFYKTTETYIGLDQKFRPVFFGVIRSDNQDLSGDDDHLRFASLVTIAVANP
jgi:hypothetical protein